MKKIPFCCSCIFTLLCNYFPSVIYRVPPLQSHLQRQRAIMSPGCSPEAGSALLSQVRGEERREFLLQGTQGLLVGEAQVLARSSPGEVPGSAVPWPCDSGTGHHPLGPLWSPLARWQGRQEAPMEGVHQSSQARITSFKATPLPPHYQQRSPGVQPAPDFLLAALPWRPGLWPQISAGGLSPWSPPTPQRAQFCLRRVVPSLPPQTVALGLSLLSCPTGRCEPAMWTLSRVH